MVKRGLTVCVSAAGHITFVRSGFIFTYFELAHRDSGRHLWLQFFETCRCCSFRFNADALRCAKHTVSHMQMQINTENRVCIYSLPARFIVCFCRRSRSICLHLSLSGLAVFSRFQSYRKFSVIFALCLGVWVPVECMTRAYKGRCDKRHSGILILCMQVGSGLESVVIFHEVPFNQ